MPKTLLLAALNRKRHLCPAGRPSGWALAHILVVFSILFNLSTTCRRIKDYHKVSVGQLFLLDCLQTGICWTSPLAPTTCVYTCSVCDCCCCSPDGDVTTACCGGGGWACDTCHHRPVKHFIHSLRCQSDSYMRVGVCVCVCVSDGWQYFISVHAQLLYNKTNLRQCLVHTWENLHLN